MTEQKTPSEDPAIAALVAEAERQQEARKARREKGRGRTMEDAARAVAAAEAAGQQAEVRVPGQRGIAYWEAVIMDVLAVALFALMARIAHNTAELPFSWMGVLETGDPFLLGALGGLGVSALARWKAGKIAPTGVVVWLASAVVGLVWWGVRHHEVPHWSFMIVATVMSGILILGWRGLALLTASMKRKKWEKALAKAKAEN